MGRREARAVAAGDAIDVKGKRFTLRPICIQHLCDLERESLRFFKQEFLTSYQENVKLLQNPDGLLERKIDEASRWDLTDLPRKEVFNVSRIPVTEKTRNWLTEKFGELPEADAGCHALLELALSNGDLTPFELKELTGKSPSRVKIRYDQWWVTSTYAGMVSFIATSLRYEHSDITREQVGQWSISKIAEAARKVEEITTADLGNG